MEKQPRSHGVGNQVHYTTEVYKCLAVFSCFVSIGDKLVNDENVA
jgi:hypothetical protein